MPLSNPSSKLKDDIMPKSIDPFILQGALIGLEAQRERIDRQITQVRAALGGRGRRALGLATKAGRRRVLSAAGRKRIAAAQRKRWAEWRRKQRVAR